MNLTKRILAPLAVVVTLGFVSAACGGGDSSSEASFCSTLKKWNADSKAIEGDGGTPGSDEFTDSMKKAEEAVNELKDTAPAEIKDDVTQLADAVSTMANLDFSDPKAMQEAAGNVDEEKMNEASDNIEAYAKKNCDIDLSDNGDN